MPTNPECESFACNETAPRTLHSRQYRSLKLNPHAEINLSR
jgi:hypothetical protein